MSETAFIFTALLDLNNSVNNVKFLHLRTGLDQVMTRRTNGQWAPGQSGNPGGRPGGVAEVRELARTHTADAIACLVQEMTNGDTSHARIAAANAILDRAWGRPTQAIAGDAEAPPVQLSVETRVAMARQAIAEAFREVVREDEEDGEENAARQAAGL